MTLQSNFDCKIIIPARFKSSRFQGKPLELILGIPMIKRVWLQCIKALAEKDVFVATDSEKIFNYCEEESIQVVMTSEECLTGTDRLYEVSEEINADIYINVQGDEPLINPNDIKKIIKESQNNPSQILNAMAKITDEKDFKSPSVPKVVFDLNKNLLFMSRSPIPTTKENSFIEAYKQVCIYAFPKKMLHLFAQKGEKTPIEKIEDIEILRFLEMGIPVKMVEVSQSSIAVDYPKDIEKVENVLRGNQ